MAHPRVASFQLARNEYLEFLESLGLEREGEQGFQPCQCISLSLSLERSPLMSMLFEGQGIGIHSQIGFQLSRKAMLEGALLHQSQTEQMPDEHTSNVLQVGLSNANQELYAYAHRMQQQGRLCAQALAFCCQDYQVSLARVGSMNGLLWRRQQIENIFSDEQSAKSQLGHSDKVAAEIVSLELSPGDTLVCFNVPGNEEVANACSEALRSELSLPEQLSSFVRQLMLLRLGSEAPVETNHSQLISALALSMDDSVVELTQEISD